MTSLAAAVESEEYGKKEDGGNSEKRVIVKISRQPLGQARNALLPLRSYTISYVCIFMKDIQSFPVCFM